MLHKYWEKMVRIHWTINSDSTRVGVGRKGRGKNKGWKMWTSTSLTNLKKEWDYEYIFLF